jgi:hypothetical protein
MTRRTPAWVWILVAAMAAIASVVWDATEESSALPSALSTRPTGTAGLAELLRRQGFRVSVETSTRARIEPGTVVLAFQPVAEDPLESIRSAMSEEAAAGEGVETAAGEPSRSERALKAAVESGCTVVAAAVGEDTMAQSAAAAPSTVECYVPDRKTLEITLGDPYHGPVPALVPDSGGYGWWTSKEFHEVEVYLMGAGRLVVVYDGLSATNRYLDEHDNAEFWTGLVATLGGRENGVVFFDPLSGNDRTPGLLGAIGAWAVAAQWQLLLAFAVFAWHAGQRFGPPIPYRPAQRTARDAIEALAATLLAGRQHGTAVRLVARERLTSARRAMRLPASSTQADVLSRMPPEAAAVLAAGLAAPDRMPQGEAVRLAQDVVEAVEAAVAARRQ